MSKESTALAVRTVPVTDILTWKKLLNSMYPQVREHMRQCQGKDDVLFTLENMVAAFDQALASNHAECQVEVRPAIGMTTEEAYRLKVERYQAAVADGTFSKLASVARECGYDPASRDKQGNPTGYVSKYGPKYKWVAGYITIFVDDYGNYMTVHVGDQLVASTHPTEQFIRMAHQWLDDVLEHDDFALAQERIAARQAERERLEHQRALEMIQ